MVRKWIVTNGIACYLVEEAGINNWLCDCLEEKYCKHIKEVRAATERGEGLFSILELMNDVGETDEFACVKLGPLPRGLKSFLTSRNIYLKQEYSDELATVMIIDSLLHIRPLKKSRKRKREKRASKW